MYGQKWTSLITDEGTLHAMELIWGKVLSKVDPAQIKVSLDRLPDEYPDWPPTVGQFRAVCKIGKDSQMQPALPKPPGDEAIALDALAEMTEIIKRNKKRLKEEPSDG